MVAMFPILNVFYLNGEVNSYLRILSNEVSKLLPPPPSFSSLFRIGVVSLSDIPSVEEVVVN